MANYYELGRTNYFNVKEPEVFKEELSNYSVELISNSQGQVGFISGDLEDGIPWMKYNPDTEEDEEIDWVEIISRHIVPDELAIMVWIGNEKLRYLSSGVIAIDSNGIFAETGLNKFYEELADKFGKEFTLPEY